MERKLTTTSTLIAVTLSVIVCIFFIFRSTVCKQYWPDMMIDPVQWDFGNTFTNNMFALIFFATFCLCRTLCNVVKIYLITFFIDVLLGISGSDLIDRFVLHIYQRTREDYALLIVTVIITAIWTYASYKIHTKNDPFLKNNNARSRT